ncbi:MAG: hypothetical protein K6G75_04060, partial [Lachnospiraceae bacterium]|nr:hypothetical protein [Lachnospiraceae bacterium]
AYSLDSEDEFTYEGSEFTVSGDLNINYDFMEDGDYLYAFCIDDIYGDYYLAEPVTFYIEGDEIGFYTED